MWHFPPKNVWTHGQWYVAFSQLEPRKKYIKNVVDKKFSAIETSVFCNIWNPISPLTHKVLAEALGKDYLVLKECRKYLCDVCGANQSGSSWDAPKQYSFEI